ncbi:MAG: hypothetical protein ABWY18_08650 [Tardiphaga sp.]
MAKRTGVTSAKKAATKNVKTAGKKTVKKATKKAAKKAPKKAAKTANVTPIVASVPTDNHSFMLRVNAQPLETLALNDKLQMPLHACLDNGPGARCTLMRYNAKTHQYDIDEGDIDCAQCTHFVQPTQ